MLVHVPDEPGFWKLLAEGVNRPGECWIYRSRLLKPDKGLAHRYEKEVLCAQAIVCPVAASAPGRHQIGRLEARHLELFGSCPHFFDFTRGRFQQLASDDCRPPEPSPRIVKNEPR